MGDRPTILVLEDDRDSLRLLIDVLTEDGYDVMPVDSVKLALASVQVKVPDLMMIDIRLKRFGGSELCRRFKANAITKDIPIIISGLIDQKGEAFQIGAVDFITKPLQKQDVLARVKTQLEFFRLRSKLEDPARQSALQRSKVNEMLEASKRIEAARREAESRFRRMADAAPVMIWLSGLDKAATFLNKAWLEFRGRTIDQEIGDGWNEGVHPDDLVNCLETYSSAFVARLPYRLEYRLRRADGEYRSILCNGVPLYQEDGLFVGYVGSCVDVTPVTRSRDDQLAMEKRESLGILASGIAHDFSNLLGSVFAEADLALSEIGQDHPMREHLENISAIAGRASDMVDLLTTYAATGEEPTFQAVDLRALVNEMLRLMRIWLSRRGVSVTCTVENDLHPILANAPQIRRVVMNLLTNASDAMEGGQGSISMNVSNCKVDKTAAAMFPTRLPDGDYISLSVTDAGLEMTEETLAKVLDPFFTTKSPERGMGLAVVQGIVHSHGGAMRVKRNPGRGCTFEVLLPCTNVQVETTAGDRPKAPSIVPSVHTQAVSPGTVLVVEDEQTLRVAISKALQERGLNVVSVSDGVSALDKLTLSPQAICVVLMDISLPGLSGLEVFAQMRRIKPNLRVVIMSASEVDVSNLKLDGQIPPIFLKKPYRLEELIRALQLAAGPTFTAGVGRGNS